jgi:hypothetical protein
VNSSFNLKRQQELTMQTEQIKLGHSHGKKDTRELSPIAKSVVQTSREHFNPAQYGIHAELLGVGATFPHPHANGGMEHAR